MSGGEAQLAGLNTGIFYKAVIEGAVDMYPSRIAASCPAPDKQVRALARDGMEHREISGADGPI